MFWSFSNCYEKCRRHLLFSAVECFTLFGHGECARWYRLSSLDYISEKKKIWNQHIKLALMPNSKFLLLVEKKLLKVEFSFRYKEMSNRIIICPDYQVFYQFLSRIPVFMWFNLNLVSISKFTNQNSKMN